MHPLDALADLEAYRGLFTNATFWEPFVRQACDAQGARCHRITSGAPPGSFPVFVVDRRIVLKFFGPLFGGAHCFTVELEADRLLRRCPSLPTARLLFSGRLDPPGANWDWPYLGFEFLEGQSIGEVFEQIPGEERMSLASQIGGWVRTLHDLPLPENGPFENRWDIFEGFLQAQRAGCQVRQAAWGSLPPHLVAQIDGFLPPIAALLDRATPPHWIHADLTADHLIGRFQNCRWVTSGLIDFGDARVGNLYYELAALHLDLLRGDRRLLAAFLKGYGFQPPQDFTRRALSFCLLHEFNMFPRLSGLFPLTLDGLARQLWEI